MKSAAQSIATEASTSSSPSTTTEHDAADQERPTDDRRAARTIGEALATRLGAHKYDLWFGRARLLVHGRRLEVATDSPFVAKWIDVHFSKELDGAARAELGDEARIDVRVAPELFVNDGATSSRYDPDALASPSDDGAAPPAEHGRDADVEPNAPDASSPDAPAPGRRRQAVPQRPTAPVELRPTRERSHGRRPGRRGTALRRLDEFVVGRSNRLAYSTANRLIEDPEATVISPLFVHGECGVGKTHLLQGVCRRYAELSGRPDRVRYVTGEQFTNEFIAAIRGDRVDEFRRRVRKLELLAIDDVHFLSNKVRTQGEFLHTLDAIDLTGERLVLASDEHPRMIKKFSQALVSRFLSGMVVEIDRPDRATRRAIVDRLAASRNLRLNAAAADAVASRCVGSVRELEGAVTKLAALRALETADGAGSGEVGLVLVDRLFDDHGWKPARPVRLATIIDVTCERLAVSRADLMGTSRHRRLVLGRGLVAYLSREMTTHSYPEIARALGRSFHSTIHAAEQRLRRQIGEGTTVNSSEGDRDVPVAEVADQLRHEIARAAAKAGG